ncbi:hypothetical protein PV328_011776 [Microctonus aethiopoides]|uniref:Uncharacterized protein n=1 Tax=Microctonus aethiopoides TaxID=144406 RepID=A0AA39FHF0_9HYME|nr:hypothetical protein PV328_011776 [Microctonus aethiopoides]
MRPQDIAYFTKEFILKFTSTKIDRIRNKLPENLQKDEDIIAHRRCHEHYNPIAIDYDEFEGIIPLMKDCSMFAMMLCPNLVLTRFTDVTGYNDSSFSSFHDFVGKKFSKRVASFNLEKSIFAHKLSMKS